MDNIAWTPKIIPLNLYVGGGLSCQDQACIHKDQCAQHDSARSDRSQHGLTPLLKLAKSKIPKELQPGPSAGICSGLDQANGCYILRRGTLTLWQNHYLNDAG
jgi:hypothetical protein